MKIFDNSEFLFETDIPEQELIVSRTDLKGIITYANPTFAKISGYNEDELIGKPHNILRHPDMPKSIFKDLWDTINAGKVWNGYVKNLRKDGGYYWVYAEVSGVYKNGKLVEYKSLRTPVDEETKREKQLLYDRLKRKEEGISRAIIYINSENGEKIKKFAKEIKQGESETINKILNDYLL